MADAQGSRSIGRSLQNPSFETTVFAPTNGAFARMLYAINMTVDEFLMQPSLMNQVRLLAFSLNTGMLMFLALNTLLGSVVFATFDEPLAVPRVQSLE